MSNEEIPRWRLTFPSALLLLFIGLKLGKVISWSWWWVMSPLWIPLALIVAVILFCVVVNAFMKSAGLW